MKKKTIWLIIAATVTLLAACTQADTTETPTLTSEPDTISTSVALTVESELMSIKGSVQTATQPAPINIQSPVTVTSLPTSTPQPSPTFIAIFEEHLEFVADLTIPDGTVIQPGEAFTKSWRIRNIGRNTWTTEYTFVFINGNRMQGEATKLPKEIVPGEIIDIAIVLIAPQDPGTYSGFWMLSNEDDEIFGGGEVADQAIFVEIDVLDPASSPVSTTEGVPAATAIATTESTPEATTTPTPGGVANVTLSVDNSTFTGICPHNFNFSAEITINGPATVEFQLEATTDDPAFVFTLEGSSTFSSQQVGVQTIVIPYTLNIETSVTAQAMLHVLAPIDVTSNIINFTVTCE